MRYKLLLIIAAFIAASVSAQEKEAYFLSQPCLTPDGQTVIFSFEGDLWKASMSDGHASRMTAMQGYEGDAKVSPDGKWVAFTGRQYGNADVFVMPIEGGEVKQLTFFSGNDNMSSWSWDSKYIYFTSSRAGRQSSYKVSINGGTAQHVFGYNFFLNDHNVFENPSTGELFFNDTWESSNQVQRKRYKGPYNADIQSYNPSTKKYKRYTDWIGKDFGATFDKSGHMYFISDEANGEYNLYTFDKDKKTALTAFTSSIKSPIVNANGGKVVFEKDYQLWEYDVAGKKSSKLNISIVRNNTLPQEKDFDIRGRISAFDISPDGKKMAMVSRGELFVSDVEGKFIEQVQRGSAEKVSEVKWMSDNRTLLFNQTVDGYQNLYSISATGIGLQQLTHDKKDDRSIVMNKKRTQAVYLSGRDEVRMIDLKTMDSKNIVHDEIWGFQSGAPGFSPDDNYVVFTAHRNFEEDIFVYDIKQNKTMDLTNTAVTEASPVWSADGKYIYFVSSRLHPSYPTGVRDARIYRMPLQKFDAPYRLDKFNELFKEEKKDSTKKKDTVAPVPIKIDVADIMDRLEHIGPSFGGQQLVDLVEGAGKTTVLYNSNHAEGRSALYKTVLDPFDQPKTDKINGTDGGVSDFVGVNDKYYVLLGGTVCKLDLNGNKIDAISTGYTFRRNLAAEFNQVFYEAWAQIEQNYYDEKFHGLDWVKTKNYYKQFLPHLNNRNDLRTVLNDMLGELNSSHQGFSSGGDEERIILSNSTNETGIVFDDKDPYKVKYVLNRSNADNKDVSLQEGDVLVKVNGVKVDPSVDRYYYFTRPSLDKEMELGFQRNGQPVDIKIHPQPSLNDNLYDEWINTNQKRVDEKSNKRIAYSCMKDMGQGELEHFLLDMTKQLANRDALILDLRYNTGGNVHDEVLRFLAQKSYLQWKYREGQMTKQSNFAPSDKPIILLTNEQSLSDAEMTAAGFKSLKLGKIIGNETYHWIIFTSGAGLVDGSFVRLPAWGCYTLDGKDIEFNGVQPDIKVINTFEDKINGRDPQLETAISEILKQLK